MLQLCYNLNANLKFQKVLPSTYVTQNTRDVREGPLSTSSHFRGSQPFCQVLPFYSSFCFKVYCLFFLLSLERYSSLFSSLSLSLFILFALSAEYFLSCSWGYFFVFVLTWGKCKVCLHSFIQSDCPSLCPSASLQ